MDALKVLTPVSDFIDEVQAPSYANFDCHNPLHFGIFLFPLAIYDKIRELNHGNPGSGID